jgi:hypothetical protein
MYSPPDETFCVWNRRLRSADLLATRPTQSRMIPDTVPLWSLIVLQSRVKLLNMQGVCTCTLLQAFVRTDGKMFNCNCRIFLLSPHRAQRLCRTECLCLQEHSMTAAVKTNWLQYLFLKSRFCIAIKNIKLAPCCISWSSSPAWLHFQRIRRRTDC